MADLVNTIAAHGHQYRINNPGGRIGKPIARGAPYERKLLEWIFRERHSGTAVDVGAHVGNHSLWFAEVCGLQVHAFEPIRFEALTDNIALNRLEGVIEVHPVALGATEDIAEPQGRGRLTVGSGSVPVRTLDSFELSGVTVLKADVEFMEPDVLRGGEATICGQRPTVYVEVHDEARHDAIADVLEPWGYRHTRTINTASPVERWAHEEDPRG